MITVAEPVLCKEIYTLGDCLPKYGCFLYRIDFLTWALGRDLVIVGAMGAMASTGFQKCVDLAINS